MDVSDIENKIKRLDKQHERQIQDLRWEIYSRIQEEKEFERSIERQRKELEWQRYQRQKDPYGFYNGQPCIPHEVWRQPVQPENTDYLYKRYCLAEYGSESAYEILKKRAAKIDLGKIGVISSGLIDFYLNDKLRAHNEWMIKIACAQALISGIGGGQTEGALAVREIWPQFDLLYSDGQPIKNNNWYQPHPLKRYGEPDGYYQDLEYYSVYQTGRDSKNDQKIILFTGLEFLNGFNGVAAEEIQFWRKGVKIIDRIQIPKQLSPLYKGFDKIGVDDLTTSPNINMGIDNSILSNTQNLVYHNNMMIFQTAIMAKKNDIMDIKFAYSSPRARSIADHDEIKLKGWVVEALGMNVMG